jgi:DNA (cytosine-5)-methyltransferase 1
MTLRALDLFAGAGGATAGLMGAGFTVTAIDVRPQPHNPADRFLRGDVLALSPDFLAGFDFIWASPPCQRFTTMRFVHNAKRHADLIAATRELLLASGRPFAIENVVGAPLRDPILLCGTMFGLATPCGAELRRHRRVETSFPVSAPPPCRHRPGAAVIGIYGGHYRNRRRPAGSHHAPRTDFAAEDARVAMGIDWPMTSEEISQAIPPAYAQFIAEPWLRQAQEAAAKERSNNVAMSAKEYCDG